MNAGDRHVRRLKVALLWDEQPGLWRGYLADVAATTVIGVLLIVGGRDRTRGPAWHTLNDAGGPLLWGTLALVVGVGLALAGLAGRAGLVWALRVTAVLYVLLGYWWCTGAVIDDRASFIGVALAVKIAFMTLSRAEAYRAGGASAAPR